MKFCHRFAFKSIKIFLIWLKEISEIQIFPKYFFQYLCYIFWTPQSMTLILLGQVSLQFNLADQSKKYEISKKNFKNMFYLFYFTTLLVDGEMAKILKYLNFKLVVIKNWIKYRNKNAIFFFAINFEKMLCFSKFFDYSARNVID